MLKEIITKKKQQQQQHTHSPLLSVTMGSSVGDADSGFSGSASSALPVAAIFSKPLAEIK